MQAMVQLVLCWTDDVSFKSAETDVDMRMAKVCSGEVENKAQCVDAHYLQCCQLTFKEPDENAGDDGKYQQPARVVADALDRVYAKDREGRQRSGAVMDLMQSP